MALVVVGGKVTGNPAEPHAEAVRLILTGGAFAEVNRLSHTPCYNGPVHMACHLPGIPCVFVGRFLISKVEQLSACNGLIWGV